MASIRRVSRSRFWLAAFRDQNGGSRLLSTKVPHGGDPAERAKNKRLAQEIAEEFESLARGLHNTEAAIRRSAFKLAGIVKKTQVKEISVSEFLNDYIAQKVQTTKPRTVERYESIVNTFLEAIGDKANIPIEHLGVEDIETFIRFRSANGIKPKTISNDLKNLSPAFSRAIKFGKLLVNPIAAADHTTKTGMPHIPFQPEEIGRMLAKLSEKDLSLLRGVDDWQSLQANWRVAIAFGYYTGMRLGDCCNRLWSEIDFDAKIVKYVPQKTESRSNRPLEVPLNSDLIAILKSPGRKDDIHVTPLLKDQPKYKSRAWLSKQFLKIMEAAAVDPMETIDPVSNRIYRQRSFHSLRTTCNSNMANAGIEQEVRMRIVGHAAKSVNDGYTHFDSKVMADAVAAMPRLTT